MYVVGITGGIGSGKSAASDYLQKRGITVVDADQVSRQVVEPGMPALEEIRHHFGDKVIAADGTLDRRALRQIVFADAEQRKILEGITHPAIAREILRQIQASTSPYTILVSPLLLETSQRTFVNRVLVVDVPETLQVERTANRDEVPPEQVRNIMAAQMHREERLEAADDVVVNDGLLDSLYGALERLHQSWLKRAAEHD